MTESASFLRIAMHAAPVFLARGYAGVSLRRLADELGIKPASLYFHCPGGKADLYVRSLEVYLRHYEDMLQSARGRASFPNDIHRMAQWMLDNPAIDLQRITRLDLPQLDQQAAHRLAEALHDAVLSPFVRAFEAAAARAELRRGSDPKLAAAAVLALVEGLGFAHLPATGARRPEDLDSVRRIVRTGLRMLLDGVMKPDAGR